MGTEEPQGRSLLADYVSGRLTRTQLLKAIATGVTVAAIPGIAGAASGPLGPGRVLSFPFYPQITSGTYTTESPEEIVSNILTLATVNVAAGRVVLTTPAVATAVGLTGTFRSAVEAVVASEQYRMNFWSSIVPGAAAKTTVFTADVGVLKSEQQFLRVLEALAAIRTGLAVTAVREFAELGQPTLAKYAAQMTGSYAEERGIFRAIAAQVGVTADNPPNNKAFETDLFLYTRDAVAAYSALGLINGTGIVVRYRGPEVALAAAGEGGAAVIQRVPNNATAMVPVSGLATFLEERK